MSPHGVLPRFGTPRSLSPAALLRILREDPAFAPPILREDPDFQTQPFTENPA
jgi:hypothetical protein